MSLAYIPKGDGYKIIDGDLSIHNLTEDSKVFETRKELNSFLDSKRD